MTDNQEQKPTNHELAKFICDVAQKARFSFEAEKSTPIIRLDQPEHFYWTIQGTLPLIYEGKKAKLEFKTRDVNYVNALGRSLDNVAMFGGIGGERRIIETEQTLTLPLIKAGCKRESYHYDTVWIQKRLGSKKEFKYGRGQEAKEIHSMMERANEIVGERFPNLTTILESPHYWARENYGQPIDVILSEKLDLLKSKKVMKFLKNTALGYGKYFGRQALESVAIYGILRVGMDHAPAYEYMFAYTMLRMGVDVFDSSFLGTGRMHNNIFKTSNHLSIREMITEKEKQD
ncbi:MAG: hypothetical protein ABH824_00255 [Nanoarchaeota archaeon]|nr:hypothetical protein [Nanoarchaeota archaeon]